MKNKKVKPSIRPYLKKNSAGIIFYILLMLIGSSCSIFYTLILAHGIELITLQEYTKVLWQLLCTIVIIILQRALYHLATYIYYKVSTNIMGELNLDLAKQAFKLNSKTYNDHSTGTFVQRIVSDPERIIDSLGNIVDILTDLIINFVMLFYIMTLNVYVTLILLAVVGLGLLNIGVCITDAAQDLNLDANATKCIHLQLKLFAVKKTSSRLVLKTN